MRVGRLSKNPIAVDTNLYLVYTALEGILIRFCMVGTFVCVFWCFFFSSFSFWRQHTLGKSWIRLFRII